MRIFPYILTRIGGGSFDHLTQVTYTPLLEQVESLLALQKEKQPRKQHLCERLFDFLKDLPNAKAQNQIQNVRRDIFNERPVKLQALANAKQFLSTELTAELDAYLAFEETIQTKTKEAEALYTTYVKTGRQHLQQLSHDEQLKKGLVLSSQSLLNGLSEFSRKDPEAFRKKDFQVEQSVLKYLTRMYAKTSPFSTFNNLALADLRSLPGQAIQAMSSTAPGEAIVGHIRLNNYLFQYLKELFLASRTIYQHLLLRLNPTIETKEDHYLYLTNHNNTEAFQRIPANAVVELLVEIAQANPSGIRFTPLIQEVCEYVDATEEAIEQYIKQLVDYGFFEFDLGVSGIDPDWDLKLLEQLDYLVQQDVAHITELMDALRHIRRQANRYAVAAARERVQILQEAYTEFRSVCMRLHEAAGLPESERKTQEELQAEWLGKQKETERKKKENAKTEDQTVLVEEKEAIPTPEAGEEAFKHASSTYFHFKPEQIFYEDTIRKASVWFDETKLKGLVEILFDLLQELRLFRGFTDEREQMRHYFTNKYGTTTSVNLLTFYEDFYRDIKKPEAERVAQVRKEAYEKANQAKEAPTAAPEPVTEEITPEPLATQQAASNKQNAATKARHEQLQQWTERLVAALRTTVTEQTDRVNVPIALLHDTNTSTEYASEKHSYGAFIQLYQEMDENGEWQLKGVLNATMAGYGKMLSRFLHILPPEVTQTVREWNAGLQDENSLFIEDCDASYFNANLHPPLMPFEIRMPGGHNSLSVEQQLPITDFEVSLNQAQDTIQLIHKPTAKRAYVFDLGFQGHGGRSQLFQLLDKFTQAEYLSVHPLLSAVNKAVSKPEGSTSAAPEQMKKESTITIYPRVVYENQLVIQRKTWYVPKELIPVRQPGQSDWSYYFALNEWRKSQGIVDEVYISINPHRNATIMDHELLKKLGRDDYKPQYIHFNDPLLVQLLEKLITKTPALLKIEEMLPSSQHLLPINNQHFVTEFVVQWDTQEAKTQQ